MKSMSQVDEVRHRALSLLREKKKKSPSLLYRTAEDVCSGGDFHPRHRTVKSWIVNTVVLSFAG